MSPVGERLCTYQAALGAGSAEQLFEMLFAVRKTTLFVELGPCKGGVAMRTTEMLRMPHSVIICRYKLAHYFCSMHIGGSLIKYVPSHSSN